MAKPVILTVDDDPEVLQAIARDLRQQYGDSGASAIDAVQQLKLRNEAVALFLVDQRMPQMSGVEFLEQALLIFPHADTDAAIRAINSTQIDYYLLKPWDPPEEKLYPVLDDLLDDWLATFRPPLEGIRVVGNRWSPQSHEMKDFLARNQIPYQGLDIEAGEDWRWCYLDQTFVEIVMKRLTTPKMQNDPEATPITSISYCCHLPVLTRFER